MPREVAAGSSLDPDALVLGGLRRRDFVQFVRLVNRDPCTLSEERLAMLGGFARWGLYLRDDGSLPEYCGFGVCACDGPCSNERGDLSEDERDWLHSIYAAYLEEKQRRAEVREALPRMDSYVARNSPSGVRNDRPERTARPREPRARRTRRTLVRSGSRGDPPDGDDPDPDDVDLEPGLAGRLGVKAAA